MALNPCITLIYLMAFLSCESFAKLNCFEALTTIMDYDPHSYANHIKFNGRIRAIPGIISHKFVEVKLYDLELDEYISALPDDRRWYSGHSYRPSAPQGDPRWFGYLLGDEWATEMNLIIFNGNLYFPRAAEINNWAETKGLNWQLQELGDVSPENLITLFLNNITPIDIPKPVRSVYIHDLSYHVGIILIPENERKFLQDFVDFAYSFITNNPQINNNKKLKQKLIEEIASTIDVLCGNLFVAMVKYKKDKKRRKLQESLHTFYLSGRTFQEELTSYLPLTSRYRFRRFLDPLLEGSTHSPQNSREVNRAVVDKFLNQFWNKPQ